MNFYFKKLIFIQILMMWRLYKPWCIWRYSKLLFLHFSIDLYN